jgi:RES domain-containing protein
MIHCVEGALSGLASSAKPFSGTCFRAVERRFTEPATVLNGSGTELYGGRFPPVATKAAYLSDSDQGASAEVRARALARLQAKINAYAVRFKNKRDKLALNNRRSRGSVAFLRCTASMRGFCGGEDFFVG